MLPLLLNPNHLLILVLLLQLRPPSLQTQLYLALSHLAFLPLLPLVWPRLNLAHSHFYPNHLAVYSLLFLNAIEVDYAIEIVQLFRWKSLK